MLKGTIGHGNIYRNKTYVSVRLPVPMRTAPTIKSQSGFTVVLDGIVEKTVSYFEINDNGDGFFWLSAVTTESFAESYDGRCGRLQKGTMHVDAEIY